ncbi:MAG TPA: HNH endonuclease [Blastocatellia bacterium]|nr:HNH endonuclease [Blastocatellia bacterium]
MAGDVLTRRVLLLNASYEPLGVISVPRAVRLVWKGAAEIAEHDGDRVLRSQRFTFPSPSVVRLRQYVNVRKRQAKSRNLRLLILMRDKFRCQYCGMKGNALELTIDHIVPRARGGRSEAGNLCAACIECNQRKGNRTPDEARMPLISNPAALHYGLDKAALYHAAESRPEWRRYLFLEDAASEPACRGTLSRAEPGVA